MWLNPLASLLHGQTMVDHMLDHSGPNLFRDNGSPSYSFSSSSSSSSSYSHSSAFLITSDFNVAINFSPNQELTCGHHIAKALTQQPWKWKFCQLNSSVFCLNTRRFWRSEEHPPAL